jgi:hypothetical protein
MLWFVGMAIATAAILTIGTLSAADIIRWQRPRKWSRQISLESLASADSSTKVAEPTGLVPGTGSQPPTDGTQGNSAA